MHLCCRANQWFLFARPAPDQEGRFAIVTDVGRGMRWTRMAQQDEQRQRGRRSRVVLMSRRWHQVDGGKLRWTTVANKSGHRGPATGGWLEPPVRTFWQDLQTQEHEGNR